ncbi:MarR family transcriptional regulator [Silvibacterium acidisoli]|uniref:MarR family transcriptional regulator n=1 Tax=Acidobacteriaceae bacterium ZG23-2 TaxID=2883246 RepID=UPI00406C9907
MLGQALKNPVTLPCTCANLRSASRAVTRHYNQELKREQIEITQFTILMALNIAGEIAQKDLAQLLEMDSTTLTRTLDLLKGHGWIGFKEGPTGVVNCSRLLRRGSKSISAQNLIGCEPRHD